MAFFAALFLDWTVVSVPVSEKRRGLTIVKEFESVQKFECRYQATFVEFLEVELEQ